MQMWIAAMNQSYGVSQLLFFLFNVWPGYRSRFLKINHQNFQLLGLLSVALKEAPVDDVDSQREYASPVGLDRNQHCILGSQMRVK